MGQGDGPDRARRSRGMNIAGYTPPRSREQREANKAMLAYKSLTQEEQLSQYLSVNRPKLYGGKEFWGDVPFTDFDKWNPGKKRVSGNPFFTGVLDATSNTVQGILKQLVPNATQAQLDDAALKALRARGKEWSAGTNPSDIARGIASQFGTLSGAADKWLTDISPKVSLQQGWEGSLQAKHKAGKDDGGFLGDVFGGIFDIVDPILDKLDPFHDKIVQGTAEKLTGMDQRDIFKTVAPIVAGSFLTGPLAGTGAFQSAGAGLSGMTGGAITAGTGANILAGAATGAGKAALGGGDMRSVLGGAVGGGIGGFGTGIGGDKFLGAGMGDVVKAGGGVVGGAIAGQAPSKLMLGAAGSLIGSGVGNMTGGLLKDVGLSNQIAGLGGRFAGGLANSVVRGQNLQDALIGSGIGAASGLAGSLIGGQFGNITGGLANGLTKSILANNLNKPVSRSNQQADRMAQMKAAYARMTPQQQAALRAKYGRG